MDLKRWGYIFVVLSWFVVVPARLLVEVLVTLFDMVISRYVIATILVAVFWLPCYFLFRASFGYLYWPSLVLGLVLCGLWDGCDIFTVRPFLSRYGIVKGKWE
jgi:hypothetical protein